MEDAGGGGRRSRSYEPGGETNDSTAGLTLGGILSIRNPTLLDLIRDDQTYGTESKKSWKMFRQKLRLKLVGSVCTTAVPVLASHVQINTDGNRTTTRNGTNRSSSPPVTASNTSSVPVMQTDNERNESPAEVNRDGGEGRTPATVKVSLLSLMEVDGSAYFDGDDDDEQAEVVVVVDGDGGVGGYNNCCVCMVRHKGAAFIPCGHTFCRVCSKELFVKRANCPLCNHFISEILDIF